MGEHTDTGSRLPHGVVLFHFTNGGGTFIHNYDFENDIEGAPEYMLDKIHVTDGDIILLNTRIPHALILDNEGYEWGWVGVTVYRNESP